jgi:hypothetical protein
MKLENRSFYRKRLKQLKIRKIMNCKVQCNYNKYNFSSKLHKYSTMDKWRINVFTKIKEQVNIIDDNWENDQR